MFCRVEINPCSNRDFHEDCEKYTKDLRDKVIVKIMPGLY